MITADHFVVCPDCGHRLNPDVQRQLEEIGACACLCHPWNDIEHHELEEIVDQPLTKPKKERR